ncbi:hypothetical protein BPO_1393 [Bergeyella porcorum]|uniref:PASTA domain-containing protein n=1 Tax=Bergeyella porcorum TaxID=1735111 RepID=A0AAU0F142_9FLAO
MVNQPDNNKGFYAGTVAAPVFKEIAGKTFLKTPQNIDKDLLKNKSVDLSALTKATPKIKGNNGLMPNVMGLVGRDVVPQLENAGYRVDYKGVGRVMEQFPSAGTVIKKDQKIYLKLQN